MQQKNTKNYTYFKAKIQQIHKITENTEHKESKTKKQ